MVEIRVDIGEQVADFVIRAKADCAQQNGDRQLALSVNLHADDIALAGFKLQPGAAAGNQFGAGKLTPRASIFFHRKIDAGGADELADHNAFATINNKGSRVSHQRKVAHKDFLFADLTRVLIDQLHLHPKRSRIGNVTFATFIDRILRFAKVEVAQMQLQIFVKANNWRNFAEQFAKAIGLEPFEAAQLHLSEPWKLEDSRGASVGLSRGANALAGGVDAVQGKTHVMFTPWTCM